MTYLAEVLADNPLHYWRCADPGGHLMFDLGSSKHHQQTIGGVLGYSGPNSDGGSLDLASNATFANSGQGIAFAGGPLTLEMMVWPFQNNTGVNNWINWNPAGPNYSIYYSGTDYFFRYNNTFCPGANAAASVDQTWTHLVGAYGAGAGQLYMNGVAAGGAVAVGAGAAGLAQITELQTDNGGHRGFIAEVAVYNTRLSAGRIAAHYAAIDQLAQQPIYKQAGSFGPATASGSPLSVDLASVLASVRKTY